MFKIVLILTNIDPSKRGSTKHLEGSNRSKYKPVFKVEMCNLIFMVLVYHVVLYICNSKEFKFNLSQQLIFNNILLFFIIVKCQL